MTYSDLIDRALYVLDFLATSARSFIDWLFVELDMGILGTIQPIQLISFTLILSFLVTRIILAINS